MRNLFGRLDAAALDRQLAVLRWTWTRRIQATSTDRSHGRHARRTINVIDTPTLPDWPEFTGAAQVTQLRRTAPPARATREGPRWSTWSPPQTITTRRWPFWPAG